jgi:tetratricopeptide (TPR) repeat protein
MSFNLNKLVQPECGAPNPLVAAAQRITIRSGAPRYSMAAAQKLRQPPPSINFAKEFVQREPPPVGMSSSSSTSQTLSYAGQTSSLSTSDLRLQHHNQHYSQQPPPSQQQQQSRHMHHVLMSNGSTAPLLTSAQPFAGSSSIYAGDQLETKYRNDMISRSESVDLHQQTTIRDGEPGKLDDVEFWQSISQAYIGPTTFNTIAKLRAERAERLAKEQDQATVQGDKGKSADDTTTTDADELRDAELLWHNEEELGQLVESMKLDDLDYTFDERNPFKDKFEDPFQEGLRRLEEGDIPSAALLFEASVQRDPKNALAWRYLGTTQAQNEMDKSAIRALSNCLHLDPSDQQARLAIAVSLVNESRRREACRHLLEWLIRHDKYKGIQASLESLQQLDQESSDEIFQTDHSLLDKHYCYVRDKFVEAARMSPNDPDPEVQNSLGVLFNMQGDYDKAVDCFKAALSVRQDDSLLWNRLGATLANGNKSEEAVIAYRRALEISPGFLRSRYNLAISLIHFNLYDEAAKQLIQILNTQAAGKGSSGTPAIRSRSITSSSIWNTLRTVATLMNKPELYPVIDGRELSKCNEMLMSSSLSSSSSAATAAGSQGDTSRARTSSPATSSN